MRREECDKIWRAFNVHFSCAGVLMLGLGLAMLLATAGVDHLLVELDALFGVQNRTLLWSMGALHLVAGAVVVASADLWRRGLLTLWAGWCYVIYFAGMLLVKAPAPFPVVQLVGWKIGANDPRVVDVLWRIFIGYLVAGGVLWLVWERRQWQRTEKRLLLEQWRRIREERPGQLITAPAGGAQAREVEPRPRSERAAADGEVRADFKFSCPNCGQHIRCEAQYSGRTIACPACRKEILVPGVNLDATSRARPNP